MFCLSEIIIGFVVFAHSVMKDLGERWKARLTERVDHAVIRGLSRFGKHYSEYVSRSLRLVEEQGPATTGFFRPDLDNVYVDVRVSPEAPQLVPTGLVAEMIADDPQKRRNLQEFINQSVPSVLAVVGAPGSGKTTLLRKTALDICKKSKARRDVPLLLYLRDHVTLIVQDPQVDIVTLVRRHLERFRVEDPPGWFDRRLRAGKCVVLLDGLDEVADEADRRAVSEWVGHQVDKYHKNDFVITSRPQGYLTAKVDKALVLKVQPFTSDQTTRFVHRWYEAIESRAAGVGDDAVMLRAAAAANDLLDRLDNTPALYELTVNPLLLTMIVNVHRYRGALPGRRVDLYGEICEVMLWRRQEVKNWRLKWAATRRKRCCDCSPTR
ncbi:hypothetical protein GCM10018963_01550 [Saccharothrix longispora]